MRFKVWDSELNSWNEKDEFYICRTGDLFINKGIGIHRAGKKYVAVFSTLKLDKNGDEVFVGDRLRNRNGYEFTVKSGIEGIDTCEKIGNKYGDVYG